MLKIAAAAAALVLGASAIATAQTSTTPAPSGTQAPSVNRGAPSAGTSTQSPSATTNQSGASPSATTGSSTSGSGSTTMSESDLKKRLEQQGYSDVKLKDDASSAQKGDWTGTAKKGGKEITISVDASGKVTEK